VCVKIDEDGAENVPLALGPIIYTESENRIDFGQWRCTHESQQCSGADWHTCRSRMARTRIAAHGEAVSLQLTRETRGLPREWCHQRRKPLCENLPPTPLHSANKSSGAEMNGDDIARTR
jgi:hypothetical protein